MECPNCSRNVISTWKVLFSGSWNAVECSSCQTKCIPYPILNLISMLGFSIPLLVIIFCQVKPITLWWSLSISVTVLVQLILTFRLPLIALNSKLAKTQNTIFNILLALLFLLAVLLFMLG